MRWRIGSKPSEIESGSSLASVKLTIADPKPTRSRDFQAPGNPHFLTVGKVFDRTADITIQAQIAELKIGPPRSNGGINFVAADCEIIFAEAETVNFTKSRNRISVRPTISDILSDSPVPSGKIVA